MKTYVEKSKQAQHTAVANQQGLTEQFSQGVIASVIMRNRIVQSPVVWVMNSIGFAVSSL